MGEKDVIMKQEENGNQEYYLILIGSFYHAYEAGAFALARATGYRVHRKHRKMGDILTCGFPADRLYGVVRKIEDAGGSASQLPEGKAWRFSGIDGTADENMVKDSVMNKGAAPLAMQDIARAITDFNLSTATPLQAMMFIGELQKRIRCREQG